jgi:hypothetical protein
MRNNYNTNERNEMNKINQLKASKEAQRNALTAKMDWHLRKLTEAREAGDQFSFAWHDAEIAGCELRLHQLKKFGKVRESLDRA